MNDPLSDQLRNKCQIERGGHGEIPYQEQQDSNDQRHQLQVGPKKIILSNLDKTARLGSVASYQGSKNRSSSSQTKCGSDQVPQNQCARRHYVLKRRSFPMPDEETEAKLQKFSKYVNIEMDQADIEASVQVLKDFNVKPDYYHAAINQLFMDNIERDGKSREVVARVVAQMFEKKAIAKADYLHALEEMFKLADDLIIDIPQLYKYMAAFYVMLLNLRYITLVDVRNVAQCILPQYGATMLKELLLQYEALYGKDATVMLWYESSLNPTDFIKMGSPEAAEKFLIDAQLGYLLNFDPFMIDSDRSDIQRLDGFVQLVFEKAISKPTCSETYAKMCKEIGTISIVTEKRTLSFKSRLLALCQAEFERRRNDQTSAIRDSRIKLEANKNLAKEEFEELKAQLEEEEQKVRRRAVGTVRFIGELYKHGQLTSSIMHSCIKLLIEKDSRDYDEETLECLCKLLTTIGSKMEKENSQDLSPYFDKMGEIVRNKDKYRISSRMRFMIQDVIDLRWNGWQDLNPKTMTQIQKEPETEQLQINMSYPLRGGDMGRRGQRNMQGGSKMSGSMGSGGGYNQDSLGRGGNQRSMKSGQVQTDDDRFQHISNTLECLCEMMIIIVSKMGDNGQDLSPYLMKMKELVQNKDNI